MERRNITKQDKVTLATVEKTLRRRAEDRALERKDALLSDASVALLTPEAMQRTVHQLQVHQIELEMQNDALRRTQWELENARLRYFDLYNLAPVGYCTISEQGIILEANLMAAKLLGCKLSALVKRPIIRFITQSDQDTFYQHNKHLLESSEPQTCELRMLGEGGVPFWAKVTSTHEKNIDGIPALCMVITDINEQKEAAAELVLLNEVLVKFNTELTLATASAKKANLAKSDFLSSMSHELRTPLSAILGFAQLLESSTPPPTPNQKRSVDQILQAGWYLLDLINEILDLALIESGKLAVNVEPLSLIDLLHDCRALIEPQAEKRSIRLYFSSLDCSELERTETAQLHLVQADRIRLKQVLINLLSNAIKYNKVGGTVVVKCIAGNVGRLRIYVEDSGEGLTEDKIAQLFQPFNRLGQEALSEEGSGIGLVMTKRLIELMGGEIGLVSTVGKGTTFWVELNLAS